MTDDVMLGIAVYFLLYPGATLYPSELLKHTHLVQVISHLGNRGLLPF